MRGAAGYSLVELIVVMGLAATVGAMAVPQTLSALDEARTVGAARHIAARLQRARTEAISRSTTVGVRFSLVGGHYVYAAYLDGNGNGIRAADIAANVDRELLGAERLIDHFTAVDFGTLPGLPAVDPGGAPPGVDPIRLGGSSIASFSSQATASSGSLYIRGARAQYVVRLYGDTARTRILRYDARANAWRPL